MRKTRDPGEDASKISHHNGFETFASGCPEYSGPELFSRRAERCVGRRYYLRLDEGRLVVSGRHHRSIFPASSWLEYGRANHQKTHAKCAQNGRESSESGTGAPTPFGPRKSVRLGGLPATTPRPKNDLQHEPQGKLLGQRGRGEFLPLAQNGNDLLGGIYDERRGASENIRVDRGVLQSAAQAFDARKSVAGEFRNCQLETMRLTECPLFAGKISWRGEPRRHPLSSKSIWGHSASAVVKPRFKTAILSGIPIPPLARTFVSRRPY